MELAGPGALEHALGIRGRVDLRQAHGDLLAADGPVVRAREHCADRALTDTGRFVEQDVSLRWIYVHMIEEYARHNGHADLLRERIDGSTGV